MTATALTSETFDNRHLNWTVLAEVVLAVLITQMDVLRRIFGTEQLTAEQWVLALVPAVGLFFLWELGKLVARRGTEPAPRPSQCPPRSRPPRWRSRVARPLASPVASCMASPVAS